MSPIRPVEDERTAAGRLRLALFWLVFGVFLIGTSFVVYNFQSDRTVPEKTEPPAKTAHLGSDQSTESIDAGVLENSAARSKLLRLGMLYGFLLFLVFLVAVYALSRWSRAFRSVLFHRPAADTATPDVWKMHKVPPIDDENA